MGIFNNNSKTSIDYLKDISRSMKQSQKYDKQIASAQAEAAQAEAEAARAQASISEAEARAIRQRSNQEVLAQEREDLQKRKDALANFFTSFDYDLDNADDIIIKALAMISWLDNADRSIKKQTPRYTFLQEDINDTDAFKEGVVLKRLTEAHNHLQKLGHKSNKVDYISERLNFYKERQQQEEDARLQREKKKKQITLGIIVIVVISGLIVLLVNTIHTPKNDASKCYAKVKEYVDKGKLKRAEKLLLAYNWDKFREEPSEAYSLLVKAYAKVGDYNAADVLIDGYDYGWNDDLYMLRVVLGKSLINAGMYKEAKQYMTHNNNALITYIESCVIHMCDNGNLDEAQTFIKRECTEFSNDKEKYNEAINKFNAIIASYR